jgi:hypothetical protein
VTTRKANHSKIQSPTVIKQFAQKVAKAKLKQKFCYKIGYD